MGNLLIKQIEYSGTKYYYKSPEFREGLNIIEGKNGTGKTTLVGLICYALGIYIREFNRGGKEAHKEICSDTENYVLLQIIINNHPYTLKRFFNNNTIFVKDKELIAEYPIFRSENSPFIFSDWMMLQLGITVVDIFQGAKKIKVNFSDVFRLIHYDQYTSPSKVYKEHRMDGSFVADSQFMRKVIFELLMGASFSNYYALMGKVIKLERERDTKKAVLENYKNVIEHSGFAMESLNAEILTNQYKEINLQLKKAEIYRDNLKNSDYTSGHAKSYLDGSRKKLIDDELKKSELSVKKFDLLNELNNINKLKEEVILEVTQLKKIILTHEELNLFSPDSCPYCLRHVQRKENHCICGHSVDENEYERFFYTSEEYLDILHSKQKSVETIENALVACKAEYESVSKELLAIELRIEKVRYDVVSFDST